jgi:predicted nucleic acid-binding Zn ribbon protein
VALTNLSSLISQIRDRQSWQNQNRFLNILECWREIVGEAVAKQSQPVGIYRRVLQVAVPGSVWSQALSFERRQILVKLNQKLNLTEENLLLDIHFSTAKWTKPSSTKIAGPRLRPSLKLNPQSNNQSSIPIQAPPTSALEAFQRWQTTVKNQRSHLAKCPICGCPSTKEDLERWQICRICVRQSFI